MAFDKVQVITSVERRRRFSDEEKRQIVAEAAEESGGVSACARRHGIAPNLLFSWRKALSRGLRPACCSGEALTDPEAVDREDVRLERLRLAVAVLTGTKKRGLLERRRQVEVSWRHRRHASFTSRVN